MSKEPNPDEVSFAVSPTPSAASEGKGKAKGKWMRRREAAFEDGPSDDGLRREIAQMTDGELQEQIASIPRPSLHCLLVNRRRRRLLPLLEAEVRFRLIAVRAASPIPSAAAEGKGKAKGEWTRRREAAFDHELSDDSLRREIAKMTDGELQEQIASIPRPPLDCLPVDRRRYRRLLPLFEAEVRFRLIDACAAFPTPSSAAEGKGKAKRKLIRRREAMFDDDLSDDGLRREIAQMTDGKLLEQIASIPRPPLDCLLMDRRRYRRLLPPLEAEVRFRLTDARGSNV